MKLSVWVLALATLLVLAPPALALTANDIIISPTNVWVTANGINQTTVFVIIKNGGSVSKAVDLSLSDATYGSLSPVHWDSGLDASYLTYFTAATKSGSVSFTATVTPDGQPAVTNSTLLYLDHDVPSRVRSVTYPSEAEVGQNADITVVMEDRHGNLVENRREAAEGRSAEKVRFIAGSVGGHAYFLSPGNVQVDRPVDANGFATASLTMDTMAGLNWVRVEPPGFSNFLLSINGYGSVPVSISQVFIPGTGLWPNVPADGTSQFTIIYQLKDRYNNPAVNWNVSWDTTLGEHEQLGPSSGIGEVRKLYGPKSTTGFVTVNASVVGVPGLQCSQVVEFTEMTGIEMQLSVSSITMSSMDVNSETQSEVRARVLDTAGNPVAGEIVQFQIENTDAGSFDQVHPPFLDTPYLQQTSGVTDINGYAIVPFRPGYFAISGPNWNQQATGTADVVAIWGTTTRRITLTYKNYPYLRVETSVSNSTLEAGDNLDVTVKLIGDGHLLTRGPVDAVLVPSRSGTMMKQLPDMMMHVYDGEKAFIRVLQSKSPSGGYDAVGILSSGDDNGPGKTDILSLPQQDRKYAGVDNDRNDDTTYVNGHYPGNNLMTYDDYTTLEQPLVDDLFEVERAINKTTPYGDTTSGHINPLRRAMHDAVNELIPGVNSVKAAIILVDNSWSYYGDPLARGNPTNDYTINEGNRYYPFPDISGSGYGSNQNMANYALHNNVRYYIVYVSDKENTNDRDALQELAQVTHGNYNYTANPEDLEDIYSWIGEQLTKEAAVNATMNLDMVAFENTSITWSAGDIFNYVPRNLADPVINSTDIHHFSWSGTDPYWNNAAMNPTIKWELEDDTDDWFTNALPDGQMYSLWFDVGTISIKETWQTTFRLKVKDDVNETLQFRLFGPDSIIQFENDPFQNLNLFNSSPLITIVPHMDAGPTFPTDLTLQNLAVDNTGAEFADVTWDVTYIGNFSYVEKVTYQYQDPATWIWGPEVTVVNFGDLGVKTEGPNQPGLARIDVRPLPQGEYKVWVYANSLNGPKAKDYRVTSFKDSKSYILVR